MSPQFVDFNADGHLDIVAGTFSGSPWIAFGTKDGFAQPGMIHDRSGERIVLNQFWNYDTKKWDSTTRCNPAGEELGNGHGTSALAFDHDGDGDFDLLLGDYDTGHLFLRRNEGSNAEPKFATHNELVRAGGKPINVGKMATMRALDWNGDGHQDLLIGSCGDSYGPGTGGGVWLFPGATRADNGDAQFGAPVTFVDPSKKDGSGPARPDTGLYADAADHDGDGDLDLIVGGYAMWQPKKPTLGPDEERELEGLRKDHEEALARNRELNLAFYAALEEVPEADKAAMRAKLIKAQKDQRAEVSQKLSKINERLTELDPGMQRQAFVWLYENLAVSTPATPGPDGQEQGGEQGGVR